jgi:hypothetical protein
VSERWERQLTLNLFLLCLEGCARGLSRLLQLENGGILLLASLALILIGYAQLGQLLVESRDFLIPKLEGSLRLLQHSALLLELALRFLPCHAFVLKDGSGLLKGRPFLLETSFHLLACALLLLELLLHRGEQGNTVCQVGPQLLGLFGLLLDLALLRPRPLEGCVVLLELGSSQSELRLPLRRYSPHRSQVLVRLLQCLIPL